MLSAFCVWFAIPGLTFVSFVVVHIDLDFVNNENLSSSH